MGESSRAVVDSVTSLDGTHIVYTTVGSGPGLVVIPGVLSVAEDYADLAEALAASFTVHTIERRGRGASGPQGDAYGMDKECQDVVAVQAATRAAYLVGHSFGGLIALETARIAPFRGIAVYEPGVSVGGSIATGWMPRYRDYLSEGKPLDALACFTVGAGPGMARYMPIGMMKVVLRGVLRGERRQHLYPLLQANLLEHQEVARLDDTYENYREVKAPTLIMRGGRHRSSWVSPALEQLTRVLPAPTSQTFPRLDHFGPDQSGPGEVAEAILRFFRDSEREDVTAPQASPE